MKRVIAFLLVCCLSNFAFAIDIPLKENALKFAAWCEETRNGPCRAYTVTLRGALAAYSDNNPSAPHHICVPDPIAGDELTDRIITRIKAEKKFHTMVGQDAIMAIIEEDYRCKD